MVTRGRVLLASERYKKGEVTPTDKSRGHCLDLAHVGAVLGGLFPWDRPTEVVAHFDWAVHLSSKSLTINILY